MPKSLISYLFLSLFVFAFQVARSITDFNFNKSRVRMLSKQLYIPENCDGIVYWMSREQRVQGDIYFKNFNNYNTC